MHYVDSIITLDNMQNLSYNYDKFGNFEARKDNLRNLEETFHYDKMNRLTDIYLGTTHSQIVYDPVLPNLPFGSSKYQHLQGEKNTFPPCFSEKNTIFATEKNILP